jgi:hypothetical protein
MQAGSGEDKDRSDDRDGASPGSGMDMILIFR